MEGGHEEQQQAHDMGKKGGMRLIPVIIANEVSERILSASVTANLIIYLTTKYHLGAATSAIIIFVYQAAANFLPFCGAIVSDALLGRYLMVTVTLFFCTIGATLMSLTSVVQSLTPPECALPNQVCSSPTALQLLVLCASLGFMSLGASGVRPCCLAFAEDQIAHWDAARRDRALRRLFSWYYVSVGFSQMVAVTVLVLSRHPGLENRVYRFGSHGGVSDTPELGCIALLREGETAEEHVGKLTTSGRCGCQEPPPYRASGKSRCSVSQLCRFLNKACILRTQDGTINNEATGNTGSWNTCTVEQVENLKSALSVMPMWSAMVVSFLVQSSSFGVLQASTMDRRIGTTRFQIPAGSISIFEIVTFTVWSGCYDPYVVPFLRMITGRQRVLTLKQRMGIGVFLCVASMAVASAVEARRRQQGALRMSALWLVPQYVLSGLSGAFGAIAQIEFYYAVLPKNKGSLVLALLFFGAGVASIESTVIVKLVNVVTSKGGATPWISDDLNRGHYDYYYMLLAVLGAIDLVYLLVCAYVFDETTQNMSLETGDDVEAETVGVQR
ncbi:hypothetical protein PR202_ga21930 [Eleusine coracana subsp. coracana]|uniref:Uncharacterized protein n=1 Tax=Eleusine coracana subsp. coracana TaxID=191504 RepID=A0AAV5D219_ELECO|nr:hypothetical protein PR202_ga21930 [Eleusine coracana subsp. coracana]